MAGIRSPSDPRQSGGTLGQGFLPMPHGETLGDLFGTPRFYPNYL